jgi:hypothetical protein
MPDAGFFVDQKAGSEGGSLCRASAIAREPVESSGEVLA